MAGLDLARRVNAITIAGVLEPKITNADVIRSYYGLLVLGRTVYEEIELYRTNGFFRRTLGITWLRRNATPRQERVPSGKFATNAMILQTAMMAFNPSADGYLACKYVQRSHRHFLKFNHTSPWLHAVEVLYARL